ncbi:MAG: twin-arginine translocation signal domain-containing protein, partial [Saprospiraceae bacterium]
MENSRRDFIKKTVTTTSIVAAGGVLPGISAASYRRIKGANERFLVSIMGVNSRGAALGQTFASQSNCDLIHVCDVDSRALESFRKTIAGIQDTPTIGFKDFRKSLESKDIDAFIIS